MAHVRTGGYEIDVQRSAGGKIAIMTAAPCTDNRCGVSAHYSEAHLDLQAARLLAAIITEYVDAVTLESAGHADPPRS